MSTPLTLVIKRSEINQSEYVIKNVFKTNNIGVVKSVSFQHNRGKDDKPYYTTTVVFEYLFSNATVNQLITELMSNQIVKFTFLQGSYSKYWFIQKVRETTTTTTINNDDDTTVKNVSNNNNLSDKEYILELEKKVNSLTTQLLMEQTLREKNERSQMGREYDDMRAHINSLEQQRIIEEQQNTINALNNDLQIALDTSEIYLRQLESLV